MTPSAAQMKEPQKKRIYIKRIKKKRKKRDQINETLQGQNRQAPCTAANVIKRAHYCPIPYDLLLYFPCFLKP